MKVTSPKIGKVIKVYFIDGDSVVIGDKLFELDDIDEQRDRKRLDTIAKLIEISKMRLSDEEINRKQQISQLTLDIAKKYYKLMELRVSVASMKREMNVATDIQLETEKVELIRAAANVTKAQILYDDLLFAIEIDKKTQQTIADHIPEEEKYLDRQRENLTIRSPAEGIVKNLVGVGSYIDIGHIVAIIGQKK